MHATQLVAPLPKNINDADVRGCWRCGQQQAAFTYLLSKESSLDADQAIVCTSCVNNPSFEFLDKALVGTDYDTNVAQRMLLDQLRSCDKGQEHTIDMAYETFNQVNITEAVAAVAGPNGPTSMSEEDFKAAMKKAILRDSIKPEDIKRWLEKSKRVIPSRTYTAISKSFNKAHEDYDENPGEPQKTRQTIVDWLMKNYKWVYCQPTLDQLVGDLRNPEENLVPFLLDAYKTMHERAKLPDWDNSTKYQQTKWLRATLVMWGQHIHGTGPHFDWSTAHNVVFYLTAKDGQVFTNEVLAYWFTATQPTQAAYEALNQALMDLANHKVGGKKNKEDSDIIAR